MKQTDPQLKIRLPPDLKQWIEEEAKRHNRSMNAEIVSILQERLEYEASFDHFHQDLPPRQDLAPLSEADVTIRSKEDINRFFENVKKSIDASLRAAFADAIADMNQDKK